VTAKLILKRAAASRPSGEWKDDDYDVVADGVVVGRIVNAAAPVGTPWMPMLRVCACLISGETLMVTAKRQ
jgi:hypothetical protein